MNLSLEDLIKLFEKAKEIGISEFTAPGVKFKFKPEGGDSPRKREVLALSEKELETVFKPQSPLDDLTPEEILYYATPRFDEIQAEKKAHEANLNSRSE